MFAPKRRQKAIFGRTRRQLGRILRRLAQQKDCEILEGDLTRDHVRFCIGVFPMHPVALVIQLRKGRSAMPIARLCGKELNCSGEHFWARGYAVPAVGFELKHARQCISEQD